MHKKFFTPLTPLLCLFMLFQAHAALASPAAANISLIAGGAWDNPPFEFINDDGEPAGLSVEVLQAVGRVMGHEVRIVLEPLNSSHASLLSGQITVIQGMAKTRDRERMYIFSEPVGATEYAIFARQGAPSVASLNDMRGKVVVVKAGGFMSQVIPSRYPDIRLVHTFNISHALSLLAGGEVDYLVCPARAGSYYMDKGGYGDIRIMGAPVQLVPLCYAADKETGQEIIAVINEGLEILRRSGEYQTISDRWLSPLDPRKPGIGVILRGGVYIIVPLALFVLLFFGWSRILARKVAEKTRDLQNEVRLHEAARHELEVRQAALRRADRMASLGTMAAGIAHEINTPNGYTLLNLPILERVFAHCKNIMDLELQEHGDFSLAGQPYSQVRDEIPQLLADMRAGGERIKNIVGDLKGFVRSDFTEEAGPLSLNELVDDTLRVLQSALKQAKAQCLVEPGSLPLFHGRAMHLQQVLTNLVLNACEALSDPALPAARRVIRIRTWHRGRARELILEISDSGPGIPPEHLERITDPFYTTKREKGGTGLGLFVAANIVEQHGGRLEFDSSPDGATVRLILPETGGEC